MKFEKNLINDIFLPYDHTQAAEAVLAPELYDQQALRELIEQEAGLAYADETIMQRILEHLGGESCVGDPYADEASFFGGALLALVVCDELATKKLGDIRSYRELWLSDGQILDAQLLHEGRLDTDTAVIAADGLQVGKAYTEAIDKISSIVAPDVAAGRIVYAGFAHTLAAGLQCVATCVQQHYDNEVLALFSEDALEQFIHETDLTGRLQELDTAFLQHCEALGIDSTNLDNDTLQLLTELLARDLDHCNLPDKVTVCGPAMMVAVDAEPEHTTTPILLEQNYSLRGKINTVVISAAPCDESYILADNLGNVPMRYMPALVISDAEIVLSDSQTCEEPGAFIVGVAQPKTLFHDYDA